MHGDTLCTDDAEYQQFRRQVRDPQWQQAFLRQTPQQRLETARHYRGESARRTADKAAEIMDVSQQAVIDAMTSHRVSTLIHGHTHRPGMHTFSIDGSTAQRIVLGDWYDQGSALELGERGFELKALPLT
jgi:UDP-2,3-diacylglucosamine hydrolase